MRLSIKNNKRHAAKITFGAAIGVFAALLIFAYFNGTPSVRAQREGERLITLHDRGVSTAFMTSASTIEEALKAANVELDGHDAVEPARGEKLVAAEYQVNIYRARPVTVIDGALRKKVLTPYQSAERIVNDVNIELYPEDMTRVTRSDDILQSGSSLQLEITRATPFNFTLYGNQSVARTQAGTVGEMLTEQGVKLAENDRVAPAESTPLAEGMDVRVWREGKQTIAATEEVDFKIEKIQDADQPVGYKQVKTPGQKGERSVTYEVVIQDGKEVSRTEIASVTLKESKVQVEVIGTKYPPITGTCGEWMAAAGVASTSSANYLIAKESGCNPRAVNKSSGACGIGQALPCRKMGPVNPDGTSAVSPVDQMKWMNSYVLGRYGSWEAAANAHRTKGWY